VFDFYSLYFYFNVYLLYVAHVSYIINEYGMVWYGMVEELYQWRSQRGTKGEYLCQVLTKFLTSLSLLRQQVVVYFLIILADRTQC